jgi:hypothetical protein
MVQIHENCCKLIPMRALLNLYTEDLFTREKIFPLFFAIAILTQ